MNSDRFRTFASIDERWSPFVWAVCAAILIIVFRGQIFLTSVDIAHHFQLVDQLARYGGVNPADVPRLGDMAVYPPAAHWVAAMVGKVEGSGLSAMFLIAIVSVFLCYTFICKLVQGGLPLISLIAFWLLALVMLPSHSLVGWEIVGNFFYPQMLGDVLFFAFLLWLASEPQASHIAVLTPVLGALVMFVQPLIAIHVMGAGMCLLAYQVVARWIETRAIPYRPLVPAVGAGIASVVVIALHPALKTMRKIASWDGVLNLGYAHISIVVAPAIGVALVILWLKLKRGGARIDAAVGCALLSSAIIVSLQDLLWLAFGEGSPYAVKKHMFLVATLMLVGIARLVGRVGLVFWKPGFGQIGGVLGATGITVWVALPQIHAAAPVLDALKYATKVKSELHFLNGAVVAHDNRAGPLENAIVTLVGFGFPNRAKVFQAIYAGKPDELASEVMVRRNASLDSVCSDRRSETSEFEVIAAGCLRLYVPGTTVGFQEGAVGSSYTYQGWSVAESWGRWSIGSLGGTLRFSISRRSQGALELTANAFALVLPTESRTIRVFVDGTEVAAWKFDRSLEAAKYSALIPAGIAKNGQLDVSFVPDGVIVPARIGMGRDERELGIGLKSLAISECSVDRENRSTAESTQNRCEL